MIKKISIIGAGAWGTALASVIAEAGTEVMLYARNDKVVEEINNLHSNETYLAGVKLNESMIATNDLSQAVSFAESVLLVVPAQNTRGVCKDISNLTLSKDVPLVICSKGIEIETLKLMSQVVKEILPDNPVAVLSGPNLSKEIANNLPSATTLACDDEKVGADLVAAINSHKFRVYYNNDVIGAEVSGAVKNVLAIACGIAIGKGLGENARAALVTRGLAEIAKLCKALGGSYQTLFGLSGIGDIVLTCSSLESRNMSFGYQLGKGESQDKIMSQRSVTTEGFYTAISLNKIAEQLNLDMPICKAVYNILHKAAPIDDEVSKILDRPIGQEVIS